MHLFPSVSDPPRSDQAPDVHQPAQQTQSQCAMIQAGGCRLELHIHIHQGSTAGPAVSVNQVQQQAHLFPAAPRLTGRDLAQQQFEKMSPVQLLQAHGVRQATRFAHLPRERVVAVIRAAKAKKRHNVGGWISSALTLGWSVDEYDVDGDEVTIDQPAEEASNG